jgi:hypothetical protein
MAFPSLANLDLSAFPQAGIREKSAKSFRVVPGRLDFSTFRALLSHF